jgi:D-glutamate N-acetyltransferase
MKSLALHKLALIVDNHNMVKANSPEQCHIIVTIKTFRRSNQFMRKIAILAEGSFEWHYGKTATGVIRYGKDTVVAVIDSTKAGMDVPRALGGASFGHGIPVVQDINEALKYQPDSLLIGIAPMGGALPGAWRWQLLTAIDSGLDIISGLHFFLSDDAELRSAAAKRGVTIWDVRRPPDNNRVAQFIPHRPGSHTILMVGSDCAVGKMTVALELDREANNRGLNSAFVATGQTGIMISGNGLPVDRIISDFVAGMVEEMVIDFTNKHDWVFVEGQGALNHPGYSPVTLGLIHGSMPEAMIFCHKAGTTEIEGYNHCLFPSLNRMIQLNKDTVSWVRPELPCKVVGLALMTFGLSEQEARDTLKQAEDETGLPATDVMRYGAGVLMDALSRYFAS